MERMLTNQSYNDHCKYHKRKMKHVFPVDLMACSFICSKLYHDAL